MDDPLRSLVYTALLGETTWQHFLDRLASTVSGGKAALVAHDTSSGEGFSFCPGCNEKAVTQYNGYYSRLNPLQPPLSLKAIGIGACDFELYPRDEFVKTEFYNDYLVPFGMPFSAGVRLAKIGDQSYTLVTCGAQSEAIERSITSLNALAPHLRRAFGFYRKEGQGRGTTASGFPSLMNAVDIAAIAINDERRITAISKAAEAIVEDASPLRVSVDGRARFRKGEAQSAYEQMLKRNYDGPATVEVYSHWTKITLVRIEKEAEALYFEGATIVVLLDRFGARSQQHDPQLFAEAYGLSRGEIRALSGIVEGKSVSQIAEEASLSRETIRSQIKSLYLKTGATGEADILRLMNRQVAT